MPVPTPSPSRRSGSFLLFLHLALPAQQPTPAAAALPADAPAAMATIRGEDLLAHARWYASDELQGRLTGSPGQQQAAAYTAAHFQRLGFEPLGDDDGKGGRSFLQAYPITRTTIDPAQTSLKFGDLDLRDDYAVLCSQPCKVEMEGQLRFFGLGRLRGDDRDLEQEGSLRDTVPVVLVRTPRGSVDRPLGIEQKFLLAFTAIRSLASTSAALEKRGARLTVWLLLDDRSGIGDVLNYVAVAPGKDRVAARFPGADNQLDAMGGMVTAEAKAPMLILAPKASADLLRQLGIERSAVDTYLETRAAKDLPTGHPLPAKATLVVQRDREAVATNVVAVLRGGDPALAGEAVVFSAHHDHVGRRLDGEVYNGADDNASGSAGLLGIASAFAAGKQRPRRSVIFLSVSGEELGLWGSKYYAEHPTWPFAQIVADVNTDMIGRSGPETGVSEVLITPSHAHARYSSIVRDAAGFAERLGLTLLSGDKYYTRSDHYNFVEKGTPAVFFCNGEHADYHQVTDEAAKLEPGRMEVLTRLAFWTGYAVANADGRPTVLGKQPDWK